jgi:hypothetical protein
MKKINHLFLILFLASFVFSACEKADSLSSYADGVTPVLSASTLTVNPPPSDADKVVLRVNWTDPKHAQDKSLYKYYLEIDSSGKNFTNATIINIDKKEDKDNRSYAFLGKDLNTILLSYGFEFNKAYSIDIRLISSYANNNDLKKSEPVKISATPYKIPPKVELPSTGQLFIVGDATEGGWVNPVPVPLQELERIDETTFGGIFKLNGDKQYLLLPSNGSWDKKYAIKDNLIPGVEDGGDFFYSTDGSGSNFKGPATSGFYKITLDFQTGKYKVEPFTQQHGLPTDLFIVGGATPGGWVNPVPVPSQQLTRRNSVVWDITLDFTSGQAYLLLPTNGDWGRKFGVDDPLSTNGGIGGNIKPEGADIPAPANNGTYKFAVDFYKGTFSLTPQ